MLWSEHCRHLEKQLANVSVHYNILSQRGLLKLPYLPKHDTSVFMGHLQFTHTLPREACAVRHSCCIGACKAATCELARLDLNNSLLCDRGKFQWLGRQTGFWTSPADPAVVNPFLIMYSGFEMRGNFKEQTFTAYGALFGAPNRVDQLVSSRRDYTYAVSSYLPSII